MDVIKDGGRFDFDDGGSYVGEWENGRAHGLGIATGPENQGEFSGEWVLGFESRGVYVWPSGNIYEGTWLKGKRHGEGVQIKGRWVYKGNFTTGFCGRYGVKQSLTSVAKYEGSWHLNQFDGFGIETNSDGSTYAGAWSKGVRQGLGVRKSVPYGLAADYHDKSLRPSQSQNSMGSGNDSDRFFRDQSRRLDEVRSGFVLRDRPNASAAPPRKGLFGKKPGFKNAILRKLRKQKSTGDLNNPSLRIGRAGGSMRSTESGASALTNHSMPASDSMTAGQEEVVINPNVTESYSGQWNEDKRCGHGVAERSDGLKYEGEWFNNKKDGFGVTTFADGSKEEGRYKANQLVTALNKRNRLLMLRHSRLRESVEEASKKAQEAAKDAQEKAVETANQRASSAKTAASQAELKAKEAHALADKARQISKELAPDFVQPGVVWERNRQAGISGESNPFQDPYNMGGSMMSPNYRMGGQGFNAPESLRAEVLEVSGGSRRGSFRSSYQRNNPSHSPAHNNLGPHSNRQPPGGPPMISVDQPQKGRPLSQSTVEELFVPSQAQASRAEPSPLRRTQPGRDEMYPNRTSSIDQQRQKSPSPQQQSSVPLTTQQQQQMLRQQKQQHQQQSLEPSIAPQQMLRQQKLPQQYQEIPVTPIQVQHQQGPPPPTPQQGQMQRLQQQQPIRISQQSQPQMPQQSQPFLQQQSQPQMPQQSQPFLQQQSQPQMPQQSQLQSQRLQQQQQQQQLLQERQQQQRQVAQQQQKLQERQQQLQLEQFQKQQAQQLPQVNAGKMSRQTSLSSTHQSLPPGQQREVFPAAQLDDHFDQYGNLISGGMQRTKRDSGLGRDSSLEESTGGNNGCVGGMSRWDSDTPDSGLSDMSQVSRGSRARRRTMPSIMTQFPVAPANPNAGCSDIPHDTSMSSENLSLKNRPPVSYIIENGIRKRVQAEMAAGLGARLRRLSDKDRVPQSLVYEPEQEELAPLPRNYRIESQIALRKDLGEGSLPDVTVCRQLQREALMTREEVTRLSQARRQELLREAERRKRGEIVIRLADIKDWVKNNVVIILVLLINVGLGILFITLLTTSSATS